MNMYPGQTASRNQGLQIVLISTLVVSAIMVLFSIFAWMKLAETERMMTALSFLVSSEELSQIRTGKYFMLLNVPCWGYLIYNCAVAMQRKPWARISLLVMYPLTILYSLFLILIVIVMMNESALERVQGYLGLFLLFLIAVVGIAAWGLVAMLGRAARTEFAPAAAQQQAYPSVDLQGSAPIDPQQPPFPDNQNP